MAEEIKICIVREKLVKLLNKFPWIFSLEEKEIVDFMDEMKQEAGKAAVGKENLDNLWDLLEECIDYQLFDMEATIRQREYYKRMLDRKKE